MEMVGRSGASGTEGWNSVTRGPAQLELHFLEQAIKRVSDEIRRWALTQRIPNPPASVSPLLFWKGGGWRKRIPHLGEEASKWTWQCYPSPPPTEMGTH